MRYLATVTTVFRIDAENITEARRLTKRMRCLGEVFGSRTPKNNRDSIRYSVDKVSESISVKRGTDE